MVDHPSADPSLPRGGSQPKLLDRVRHAIRVRHYSRRTEEAYVHRIRRYIVFHRKTHPSYTSSIAERWESAAQSIGCDKRPVSCSPRGSLVIQAARCGRRQRQTLNS